MTSLIKYIRRAAAQATRKRLLDGSDIQKEQRYILGSKSAFYTREAYKTLRTNVTFSLTEEGCKVIAVTSAMASEGKSITVLNLAISFAETGQRVLLIDGDLRRPNQARLLSLKAKPGLSNVLVNLSAPAEAVRHTDRAGLDVLLSGDIPPNPTELLGSERMGQLVEELKGQYDYIFMDTPPVNVVADATILSKYTSGMLFIVLQGASEKDPVVDAVAHLEFAGAKLLGFILNGVRNEGGGRYGYGKYKRGKYAYYKNKHGYGYGYGYGGGPVMRAADQQEEGGGKA